MAKKEARKRSPGKDLVFLIILVAVAFAGISLMKSANPTGHAVMQPKVYGSPPQLEICSWFSIFAYTVLLVLIIVLITYLLRRHFIGHVLHTLWAYALYGMLGLTAILVALNYLLCSEILYPLIFGIAAVIMVFIFDIILTLLARHPKVKVYKREQKKKAKKPVFERLKKHAEKPEVKELKELKKIVKSFKKKKKK